MRLNGVEVPNASLLVLLASTIATLSSGTNYVVGSYAPQLKERLHLTVAEINLVASCGNFGVYLTGPFFGYLADRKGPRSLLFAGSILLGIGYFGLFWSYENGDPSVHDGTGNTLQMLLLALFSFCTGLGSALGNTAGLNSVARAFVPATRGLAMGIVVAGYGLSAFLYASISGLLIGDNTELFLLVLAIGTFASLFGAGLLLTNARMEHAYSLLPGASPQVPERNLLRRSRSRSRSTISGEGVVQASEDANSEDEVEYDIIDEEGQRGRPRLSSGSSLLPSSGRTGAHKKKSSILVKQAGEAITRNKMENILVETGSLGLFKVPDYYLLMIVAFACTGTGIMWINSVGTVVVTLAEFNNIGGKITRLQSHQTSLLSIFNCVGRLFVGALSDQARTRLGIKPIWWLGLLCLTFIVSQMLARASEDLSSLAWATSLVGFSYGQFFGLAPIIMLDWFGLKSFSANVGTLYVIPTFSSYTFSYIFGSIYDSSTPNPSTSSTLSSSSTVPRVADLLRRVGDVAGHVHICPLGRQCYTRVFSYTIPACIMALIVSVVLSLRRGKGLERHEHVLLDEEEFLAEVER